MRDTFRLSFIILFSKCTRGFGDEGMLNAHMVLRQYARLSVHEV